MEYKENWMSRSEKTRSLFVGKVRPKNDTVHQNEQADARSGSAKSNSVKPDIAKSYSVQFHSRIQCSQAMSSRQLSDARQFWIHRYRQAGLQSLAGDPPDFDHHRIPSVALIHDGLMPVPTRWQTSTFVAYQMAGESNFSGRMTDSERAGTLCGTVTLLSPSVDIGPVGDGVHMIGRITRLAVDHSPLPTCGTPIGYRTVFLEMTSCMHREALRMGLTHLDAIVHPRHAKLYRRVFGAIPIGDPFACDEVGGSLGQYMRADITKRNIFHARLRGRYEKESSGRETHVDESSTSV